MSAPEDSANNMNDTNPSDSAVVAPSAAESPPPLKRPSQMTDEERREEAGLWRAAYSEDYRCNIAVGQMHEHKSTCFKYVIQEGLRKSKHCRFRFVHFVTLAKEEEVDGQEHMLKVIILIH